VRNAFFRCLPGCFAAISAVFLLPELSAVQGAHMALGPRAATNFNRNRLKLGLFSSNCSSGIATTKVPERWDASWENNLKLAQMADRCGLECIVPVGRWKGYGGETNFEGAIFETITWAAGLLAQTSNITVFGIA
jgi:hypothetical protein